MVAAAERGRCCAEDAWEGLVAFLEEVLELQAATSRCATSSCVSRSAEADRGAAQANRLATRARLVARARKEQSHSGTTSRWATSRSRCGRSCRSWRRSAVAAPNAWRRHLRMLLDGFRPEAATPRGCVP